MFIYVSWTFILHRAIGNKPHTRLDIQPQAAGEEY
jgi:hypothetical protein